MSTVATPAGAPARDRYIDSLRVVALVRVVTYHTFGWVWLPILFPSMGVMFALAGSLVAASLDRRPGGHWQVLRKRMTRLLPPLWAFGLVVVPVMLVAGWTVSETHGDELTWRTLVFWVLPLSTPPGSDLGSDWVLPLWYLTTYLWLLALSPAMLWLFRHWPARTLAVPLLLVVAYSVGLVPLFGRAGDVTLDLAMFAACWMLGFAHHDGMIRRLPLRRVLTFAALAMALGLAWAVRYPTADGTINIDDIPFADAFYSLGAVLVLLRLYPDFSWLARHRVLDGIVAVVNARAMTVYLWGNLAIAMSLELCDRVGVLSDLAGEGLRSMTVAYLGAWLLIGVAVLIVGWVEDVAARRRPRLMPWPARNSAPAPMPRPSGATRVRIPSPPRLVAATALGALAAGAVVLTLLDGTRTAPRPVGEVPVAAAGERVGGQRTITPRTPAQDLAAIARVVTGDHTPGAPTPEHAVDRRRTPGAAATVAAPGAARRTVGPTEHPATTVPTARPTATDPGDVAVSPVGSTATAGHSTTTPIVTHTATPTADTVPRPSTPQPPTAPPSPDTTASVPSRTATPVPRRTMPSRAATPRPATRSPHLPATSGPSTPDRPEKTAAGTMPPTPGDPGPAASVSG